MVVLSAFLPALRNPLLLLIGVFIGFLLPRMWLKRRKGGRLEAFNKQLPDTITLIANALRAGSLVPPGDRAGRARVATADLHRVRARHPRGQPRPPVRAGDGEHGPRVQSDDLELMATAITIQHQVGGNLAEILDSIAYTIRERIRIKGEINTLTAQQRMSGYVVGSPDRPRVGSCSSPRPGSWSRCSTTGRS